MPVALLMFNFMSSSLEMLLQLRRYLLSFHKGRVDCISYLGDKKRTPRTTFPLSELSLNNFQVTSLLKNVVKRQKGSERSPLSLHQINNNSSIMFPGSFWINMSNLLLCNALWESALSHSLNKRRACRCYFVTSFKKHLEAWNFVTVHESVNTNKTMCEN